MTSCGIGRWALAVMLAAVLAGCGLGPRHRPAPARGARTLQVSLAGSHLLALPLLVVAAHHLLQPLGYRLKLVSRAPIRIGYPTTFPVDGVLAWRPDDVLLTVGPEHAFRWKDLRSLPRLPVSALGSQDLTWLRAVLHDHGVGATTLESLPHKEAVALFRQGHLPWLVLSLSAAVPVLRGGGYMAAVVGASTGPVPALTVSGSGPGLSALLAALNEADALIHTTSAGVLAALLAKDFPGYTSGELTTLVTTGQGLDLWPPTTFLDEGVYQRGATLLAPLGIHWPVYSAGVRNGPETAALAEPAP